MRRPDRRASPGGDRLANTRRQVKDVFRFLRRTRKAVLCLAVAFLQLHSSVLPAFAESGFWSDRREAAQRLKDKPTLDQALPSLGLSADDGARAGLSAEQYQLLAQLPKATNFDFGITENVSITDLQDPTTRLKPEDVRAAAATSKESPTWLSTLVLPFGSIRDVYLSPKTGSPLVIHIQDAHEIQDAQKNMAAMIQGLREERGVNLVGLEGAHGAFALDPFRAYAKPAVVKGLADHFLKEGSIGGAEYVGLTAPEPPLLWGMEDSTLYEQNIQSFKDSIANKPAMHAFLSEAKSIVALLKVQAYSPELREFDTHYNAYKGRLEGLGAYVRYLMLTHSGSRLAYTNLHILMNALEWEETLDFKLVEKERLELVELLAKKLSEQKLSALIQQSLLYRLGRMGYGDYHRYLRQVCRDNGVLLDRLPQLNSYVNYVLLAEQIDRNELLLELARLEEATQDQLAVTPVQEQLVAVNRDLMVLEKLTNHNMTQADWLYYYGRRDAVLKAGEQANSVARGLGSDLGVSVPKDLAALAAPFEQFCQYAMQRNIGLVDNLLTKMQGEKATSAVLVAGGFHSDGLTQILRQKQVSYVVVTPKINEVPKDGHYLDVFAHDPLPLEKMFAGETIYLAAERLLVADGAQVKFTPLRLRIFRALYQTYGAALEDGLRALTQEGATAEQIDEGLRRRAEAFKREFKDAMQDGDFQAEFDGAMSRKGFFSVLRAAHRYSDGTTVRTHAVLMEKEKRSAASQFLEEAGLEEPMKEETFDVAGRSYTLLLFRTTSWKDSAAAGFAQLRGLLTELRGYFAPAATEATPAEDAAPARETAAEAKALSIPDAFLSALLGAGSRAYAALSASRLYQALNTVLVPFAETVGLQFVISQVRDWGAVAALADPTGITLAALALTGLIFALLHPDLYRQKTFPEAAGAFLQRFVGGVVLTALLMTPGGFWLSFAAHAAWNGFVYAAQGAGWSWARSLRLLSTLSPGAAGRAPAEVIAALLSRNAAPSDQERRALLEGLADESTMVTNYLDLVRPLTQMASRSRTAVSAPVGQAQEALAFEALRALLSRRDAAGRLGEELSAADEKALWTGVFLPLLSALAQKDGARRQAAGEVWSLLAPLAMSPLKTAAFRTPATARVIAEALLDEVGRRIDRLTAQGRQVTPYDRKQYLTNLIKEIGLNTAVVASVPPAALAGLADGSGRAQALDILLPAIVQAVRSGAGAALARAGRAVVEDRGPDNLLDALAAGDETAFDVALQLSNASMPDTLLMPVRMEDGETPLVREWAESGALYALGDPPGGPVSRQLSRFGVLMAARFGVSGEGMYLVAVRDPRLDLPENELHRRSFYTRFFDRVKKSLVGKGIGTPILRNGRRLLFSLNQATAQARDEGAMVASEVAASFRGGADLLRAEYGRGLQEGDAGLAAAQRAGDVSFDADKAFMRLVLEGSPTKWLPVKATAEQVAGEPSLSALGGEVRFVPPTTALRWGGFTSPEDMARQQRLAFYEVPVPTRLSEANDTVDRTPELWRAYFAQMGYDLPARPDTSSAEYREAAGRFLRQAALNFGVWSRLYRRMGRIGGIPTLDPSVSDFREINMNPLTVFDHGTFMDLEGFIAWASGPFVRMKLEGKYGKARVEAASANPARFRAFLEQVFRDNQAQEYTILKTHIGRLAGQLRLSDAERDAALALFVDVAGQAPEAGRPGAYKGGDVLKGSVIDPLYVFLEANRSVLEAVLKAADELTDSLEDRRLKEAAERFVGLFTETADGKPAVAPAAFLELFSPAAGAGRLLRMVFTAAAAASTAEALPVGQRMGLDHALSFTGLNMGINVVRGPPAAGFRAADLVFFTRDLNGKLQVFMSVEALAEFRREAEEKAPALGKSVDEVFEAVVTRALYHEAIEASGRFSHADAVRLGFGSPEQAAETGSEVLYDVARMQEAFFWAFEALVPNAAALGVSPAAFALLKRMDRSQSLKTNLYDFIREDGAIPAVRELTEIFGERLGDPVGALFVPEGVMAERYAPREVWEAPVPRHSPVFTPAPPSAPTHVPAVSELVVAEFEGEYQRLLDEGKVSPANENRVLKMLNDALIARGIVLYQSSTAGGFMAGLLDMLARFRSVGRGPVSWEEERAALQPALERLAAVLDGRAEPPADGVMASGRSFLVFRVVGAPEEHRTEEGLVRVFHVRRVTPFDLDSAGVAAGWSGLNDDYVIVVDDLADKTALDADIVLGLELPVPGTGGVDEAEKRMQRLRRIFQRLLRRAMTGRDWKARAALVAEITAVHEVEHERRRRKMHFIEGDSLDVPLEESMAELKSMADVDPLLPIGQLIVHVIVNDPAAGYSLDILARITGKDKGDLLGLVTELERLMDSPEETIRQRAQKAYEQAERDWHALYGERIAERREQARAAARAAAAATPAPTAASRTTRELNEIELVRKIDPTLVYVRNLNIDSKGEVQSENGSVILVEKDGRPMVLKVAGGRVALDLEGNVVDEVALLMGNSWVEVDMEARIPALEREGFFPRIAARYPQTAAVPRSAYLAEFVPEFSTVKGSILQGRYTIAAYTERFIRLLEAMTADGREFSDSTYKDYVLDASGRFWVLDRGVYGIPASKGLGEMTDKEFDVNLVQVMHTFDASLDYDPVKTVKEMAEKFGVTEEEMARIAQGIAEAKASVRARYEAMRREARTPLPADGALISGGRGFNSEKVEYRAGASDLAPHGRAVKYLSDAVRARNEFINMLMMWSVKGFARPVALRGRTIVMEYIPTVVEGREAEGVPGLPLSDLLEALAAGRNDALPEGMTAEQVVSQLDALKAELKDSALRSADLAGLRNELEALIDRRGGDLDLSDAAARAELEQILAAHRSGYLVLPKDLNAKNILITRTGARLIDAGRDMSLRTGADLEAAWTVYVDDPDGVATPSLKRGMRELKAAAVREAVARGDMSFLYRKGPASILFGRYQRGLTEEPKTRAGRVLRWMGDPLRGAPNWETVAFPGLGAAFAVFSGLLGIDPALGALIGTGWATVVFTLFHAGQVAARWRATAKSAGGLAATRGAAGDLAGLFRQSLRFFAPFLLTAVVPFFGDGLAQIAVFGIASVSAFLVSRTIHRAYNAGVLDARRRLEALKELKALAERLDLDLPAGTFEADDELTRLASAPVASLFDRFLGRLGAWGLGLLGQMSLLPRKPAEAAPELPAEDVGRLQALLANLPPGGELPAERLSELTVSFERLMRERFTPERGIAREDFRQFLRDDVGLRRGVSDLLRESSLRINTPEVYRAEAFRPFFEVPRVELDASAFRAFDQRLEIERWENLLKPMQLVLFPIAAVGSSRTSPIVEAVRALWRAIAAAGERFLIGVKARAPPRPRLYDDFSPDTTFGLELELSVKRQLLPADQLDRDVSPAERNALVAEIDRTVEYLNEHFLNNAVLDESGRPMRWELQGVRNWKGGPKFDFLEIVTPPYFNTEEGWKEFRAAMDYLQRTARKPGTAEPLISGGFGSVHANVGRESLRTGSLLNIDRGRLSRIVVAFPALLRALNGFRYRAVSYGGSFQYVDPASVPRGDKGWGAARKLDRSAVSHDVIINSDLSKPRIENKLATGLMRDRAGNPIDPAKDAGFLDLDLLDEQLRPTFRVLDNVAPGQDERFALGVLGVPVLAGEKPTPKQVAHFIGLFFEGDPEGARNAEALFASLAGEPAGNSDEELRSAREDVERFFEAIGLASVFELHRAADGVETELFTRADGGEGILLERDASGAYVRVRRLAADLLAAGLTPDQALTFFPGDAAGDHVARFRAELRREMEAAAQTSRGPRKNFDEANIPARYADLLGGIVPTEGLDLLRTLRAAPGFELPDALRGLADARFLRVSDLKALNGLYDGLRKAEPGRDIYRTSPGIQSLMDGDQFRNFMTRFDALENFRLPRIDLGAARFEPRLRDLGLRNEMIRFEPLSLKRFDFGFARLLRNTFFPKRAPYGLTGMLTFLAGLALSAGAMYIGLITPDQFTTLGWLSAAAGVVLAVAAYVYTVVALEPVRSRRIAVPAEVEAASRDRYAQELALADARGAERVAAFFAVAGREGPKLTWVDDVLDVTEAGLRSALAGREDVDVEAAVSALAGRGLWFDERTGQLFIPAHRGVMGYVNDSLYEAGEDRLYLRRSAAHVARPAADGGVEFAPSSDLELGVILSHEMGKRAFFGNIGLSFSFGRLTAELMGNAFEALFVLGHAFGRASGRPGAPTALLGPLDRAVLRAPFGSVWSAVVRVLVGLGLWRSPMVSLGRPSFARTLQGLLTLGVGGSAAAGVNLFNPWLLSGAALGLAVGAWRWVNASVTRTAAALRRFVTDRSQPVNIDDFLSVTMIVSMPIAFGGMVVGGILHSGLVIISALLVALSGIGLTTMNSAIALATDSEPSTTTIPKIGLVAFLASAVTFVLAPLFLAPRLGIDIDLKLLFGSFALGLPALRAMLFGFARFFNALAARWSAPKGGAGNIVHMSLLADALPASDAARDLDAATAESLAADLRADRGERTVERTFEVSVGRGRTAPLAVRVDRRLLAYGLSQERIAEIIAEVLEGFDEADAAMLVQTAGRNGPLVIAFLEETQSREAFEDHLANGFIGVNERFLVAHRDGMMTDIELRAGLAHELRHEALHFEREVLAERGLLAAGAGRDEVLSEIGSLGVEGRLEFIEEVERRQALADTARLLAEYSQAVKEGAVRKYPDHLKPLLRAYGVPVVPEDVLKRKREKSNYPVDPGAVVRAAGRDALEARTPEQLRRTMQRAGNIYWENLTEAQQDVLLERILAVQAALLSPGGVVAEVRARFPETRLVSVVVNGSLFAVEGDRPIGDVDLTFVVAGKSDGKPETFSVGVRRVDGLSLRVAIPEDASLLTDPRSSAVASRNERDRSDAPYLETDMLVFPVETDVFKAKDRESQVNQSLAFNLGRYGVPIAGEEFFAPAEWRLLSLTADDFARSAERTLQFGMENPGTFRNPTRALRRVKEAYLLMKRMLLEGSISERGPPVLTEAQRADLSAELAEIDASLAALTAAEVALYEVFVEKDGLVRRAAFDEMGPGAREHVGTVGRQIERFKELSARVQKAGWMTRLLALDTFQKKVAAAAAPAAQEAVPARPLVGASILDRWLKARGFHVRHPILYALYTIVGVNWEAAFQLPVLAVLLTVSGPWALPLAALVNGLMSVVFAQAHPGRTTAERIVIALVGAALGGIYLIPGLVDSLGWGSVLVSMAAHSLYNAVALALGWPTASVADGDAWPTLSRFFPVPTAPAALPAEQREAVRAKLRSVAANGLLPASKIPGAAARGGSMDIHTNSFLYVNVLVPTADRARAEATVDQALLDDANGSLQVPLERRGEVFGGDLFNVDSAESRARLAEVLTERARSTIITLIDPSYSGAGEAQAMAARKRDVFGRPGLQYSTKDELKEGVPARAIRTVLAPAHLADLARESFPWAEVIAVPDRPVETIEVKRPMTLDTTYWGSDAMWGRARVDVSLPDYRTALLRFLEEMHRSSGDANPLVVHGIQLPTASEASDAARRGVKAESPAALPAGVPDLVGVQVELRSLQAERRVQGEAGTVDRLARLKALLKGLFRTEEPVRVSRSQVDGRPMFVVTASEETPAGTLESQLSGAERLTALHEFWRGELASDRPSGSEAQRAATLMASDDSEHRAVGANRLSGVVGLARGVGAFQAAESGRALAAADRVLELRRRGASATEVRLALGGLAEILAELHALDGAVNLSVSASAPAFPTAGAVQEAQSQDWRWFVQLAAAAGVSGANALEQAAEEAYNGRRRSMGRWGTASGASSRVFEGDGNALAVVSAETAQRLLSGRDLSAEDKSLLALLVAWAKQSAQDPRKAGQRFGVLIVGEEGGDGLGTRLLRAVAARAGVDGEGPAGMTAVSTRERPGLLTPAADGGTPVVNLPAALEAFGFKLEQGLDVFVPAALQEAFSGLTEQQKKFVNILLVLAGELVYDATERIGEEIEARQYVAIQA
jgi:hypothetical protein